MTTEEFEVWATLPSNHRYQVSNMGRVRSFKHGRVLKPQLCNGYSRAGLWYEGGPKGKFVHALVAETFIGARPEGMQIDHINFNRTDNRVSNLRYCTPQENQDYKAAAGRQPLGSKCSSAKLTEEMVIAARKARATGGRNWGRKALALEYGVSPGVLTRAVLGGCTVTGTFQHIPEGVPTEKITRRIKLTEGDVQAIIKSGKSQRAIAKEFGVSQQQVCKIKKGATCGHKRF